ncbi:helix-turn-helix domain-containing protein [Chryseobacterium arthrosphaerae]|uniref:helix-turn-helix domain-containing protein n=1 Tax=Chryseobacterium arthrosphaerae TaxID=651561 RepID=UPI0023E1A0F2|nr:helix-turn-helix domain-containing protein [Chryseobacterium arthrosphaerae]WES98304.1 helix-turn-helix domain-containing protein [Chryseobacterium arthrosphaerae]
MRTNNTYFLIIFIFFVSFFQSQETQNSYKKLSSLFNSYQENDERALVFVKMYIEKAKSENNYLKLIAGYEEAIYYSNTPQRKLIYSDSTIVTALKSKNKDQISRAYLGKGIIYYYNSRNFKKALENYLMAFKYSKNSEDMYLTNKVIYHLGVVKCYLGYYDEAIQHFRQTADFFQKNMNADHVHENIKLNNESGYLNSIYRLSKAYANIGMHKKEDSLIDLGLSLLDNEDQHSIEYAYFQKGRGIQLIRQKKTKEALKHLIFSRDILLKNNDFASLATVNFYLGKLYWINNNRKQSLSYFRKVDSIVNKYKFITPEIRGSYEFLINDAKAQHNDSIQLYYTNQLLRADSIIRNDFAKLSTKIKYEYDTDRLIEEKGQLIKKHRKSNIVLVFVIVSALLSVLFLIYRFNKKEKQLTQQYKLLVEKIQNGQKKESYEVTAPVKEHVKSAYTVEQIEEVIKNLQVFEEKKQYLRKNIKLPEVATLIGTNRTTLSFVLNEHLNVHFPDYLKKLRINYITAFMLEDKKNLNYKIDTLAEMCGISTRQMFSTHFLEITGMRPTDFIRKRLEELDNQ